MKKLLALVLVSVLCVLAISPAQAETTGNAQASVYVTVDPNITLQAPSASVSAGTIQTGSFYAEITFGLFANKEEVNFRVEASHLYKGDKPLDNTVPPILLDESKPAAIYAVYAREADAGDGKASWIGPGTPIGNYPTQQTEDVQYVSSQNGHFSQDVKVKIFYIQPDPEKPQGQYSGKVRLTAFLGGIPL